MTVRWTVRAAEPTAAFSPQRKGKTVRFKSHPRNQKRFHSRYNFGYGILLSIRKMPCFCLLTAYFGGFKGVFSYINNKSAILCPGKTETADFVRLRVQSFKE